MTKVLVRYHHEDGSWWAESDQLPGFSAAAGTFDELDVLVREGVAFATDENDLEVIRILDESATLLG